MVNLSTPSWGKTSPCLPLRLLTMEFRQLPKHYHCLHQPLRHVYIPRPCTQLILKTEEKIITRKQKLVFLFKYSHTQKEGHMRHEITSWVGYNIFSASSSLWNILSSSFVFCSISPTIPERNSNVPKARNKFQAPYYSLALQAR